MLTICVRDSTKYRNPHKPPLFLVCLFFLVAVHLSSSSDYFLYKQCSPVGPQVLVSISLTPPPTPPLLLSYSSPSAFLSFPSTPDHHLLFTPTRCCHRLPSTLSLQTSKLAAGTNLHARVCTSKKADQLLYFFCHHSATRARGVAMVISCISPMS